MRIRFVMTAAFALVIAVSACSGPEPTPQPTATQVPGAVKVKAITATPTDESETVEHEPTAEEGDRTEGDMMEPERTATPGLGEGMLNMEPLPADGVFAVYGDAAVVPNGPPGAWDNRYTDPGAVAYYDGMFHMLHNGFNGWPAPVGITYSTSEDGLNWIRVVEEPVFRGDDLDYAGLTVLASSALIEEDGTWVLYFYTWDEATWPAPGKIGRATAPEPTGPWTADDAPVLEPGPDGAWDAYAIRTPSVVRREDGYVMYYAGYTESQAQIGMATSSDGVNWTKYDDPSTTDELYAESDPILQPGDTGDWDAGHVFQPHVVRTDDGWVMLYKAGSDVRGSFAEPGYALSADGVHWTRSEGAVIAPTDVPGGRAIWFTNLLHHDGTYFLFFELGTGGTTEVYLATHEGSLKP